MTPSDATSRRAHCTALAGIIGALLLGCQGVRKAPETPPEPPVDALRLRPLSELVVGAGVTWVVLVEPQEVFGHAALAPGLARLVPPSRRALFEKVTAIDLESLDQAIVAGYEESTLFVLDGVADPMAAEKRFRDRLLHEVQRKVYRPDATWTHGRTSTGKVRALSALSPGVVAIEGGGSLRAKVALLFAIGRLRKAPRALSWPDMQRVLGALGPAPIRALAPGPFQGEWGDALHGMLGVCTAVGASVRPQERGALHVSVRLAGAWRDQSGRAAENLLHGWRDLAQSTLGRLLGLDEPLDDPRVEGHPEVVGLDARVDGVKLLDGLHDVVAADIREILDLGESETR